MEGVSYFGDVTGLSDASPLDKTPDNGILWPKVSRIDLIEAMGKNILFIKDETMGLIKRAKK